MAGRLKKTKGGDMGREAREEPLAKRGSLDKEIKRVV